MSAHLDPPDACTADCCWCGTDLRPAAFCSPECEEESRLANQQPFDQGDDGEQTYRCSNFGQYERDHAYLVSRGH